MALPVACQAQQGGPWQIQARDSQSQWEQSGNTNYFTHGAILSNNVASVSMDEGTVNDLNGDVLAQGDVMILDHGHIWRGTNFFYNFKTGEVRAASFKSVQEPFSLAGDHLTGYSNQVYTATNAVITTDDYEKPGYTIRAKTITIAVGEYFEAHHATLYWRNVPIFYFPHYKRKLGQHPNNMQYEPGYRSIFGPYLLSTYNWYGNGMLDGSIHADVREQRGFATGPDLNFHLGNWGEAAFKYYYADDQRPNDDGFNAPHLSEDRQRAAFKYEVHPTTNMTIKAIGAYESDPLVRRDFFEREYETNVQPASFAEMSQLWTNYSLNVMVQPRLIDFFETVERLPDIRLTGLPQEVGGTPLYYQNESSAGYYDRQFSNTNTEFYLTNYYFNPNGSLGQTIGTNVPGANYSADRLDTFHQLSLPETFFGWLNVTPRAGGRLTYYGDVSGPAIETNQQLRAVFNTGADVSFKASRVYEGAESSLFDVHELRHIIQPEIDYSYVLANRSPNQIPQFDYDSPSLRLLPIDFPDYNNIDSIRNTNVIRLMLRNVLQTKRENGVEDLLNLALYTDWNLRPDPTNRPFMDFFTDLSFRPRTWLSFDSSTRYDMVSNRWRDAVERVVVQPSSAWSVALYYRYLINNDPELQLYPGESLPGHNLVGLSVYYRMNENWGLHILDQYEAQYGGMQQQVYGIYRDLRSWTANLFFRITEGPGQPSDFTVALTFSLKAFPRFGMGSDSDHVGSTFGSTATFLDPPGQGPNY